MNIKRFLSLVLALLLVLSCVPMGAKAADGIAVDEANFPDDNFRAWILEQDYGADGVLTQEELAQETDMNVSEKEISDLKGIEYFTALEWLVCDSNQLTTLDVSKNTALEWLNCSSNQLTSLDVSKSTVLEYLNCSVNQLTSLDVSKSTVLEYLNCSINQLTSLDVRQNPALKSLYCHSNQLTTLDVSKNTALEYLDCSSNQLTSLDMSKNAKLEDLYCYSNQLNSLDVSKNTALEYLYCYSNQLTSLDVSKNTALVALDCYKNQLTSLDLSQNPELVTVKCYSNQLTSLDVSKNTVLEYLNCSVNQLTSLDMSQNLALKSLYCYSNQLTSLDVSQNPALKYLYCYYNQLTGLDMSKNTKLEHLNCESNQLTNLDVSKNTALEWLYCSLNRLTSLDVSKNTALQSLDCGNNQLTSLDVSKNTALQGLDCGNNQLAVKLDEKNQFDLGTLPGEFDVTKASNWKGGKVSGNILTVDDGTTYVHYTYQLSDTKTEVFTLCVQGISRESGSNRFDTAIKVADQMKEALGMEKFDAVILANGYNFADALAGSYLSAMKQAPILLTWNGAEKYNYLNDATIEYVKANLKPGGTVYILGGASAVPASIDAALKDFNIQRMDGANRFETNLMILEEAGIADGAEVLVCTSTNFADSLSASAAGKPILLVFNESGKLYGDQPKFLEGLKNCTFTVIGGESAVSQKLADAVGAYGTVTRLAGKNRFETSVLVAEKYFPEATSAVLAYAWDFPDGLCGGGLAYAMQAPLILTMTKYETQAADYIQNQGIKSGVVLGGEKLISAASVDKIFGN